MRKQEDWTLIHDQTNLNIKETKVYIPINDRDLQYTQILFRSKGNQFLDYTAADSIYWYSDGFNLHFNYFAFENYNLIIKSVAGDHLYNCITPSFKLLPASSLEILQFSTGKCQSGTFEQNWILCYEIYYPNPK